MYYNNSTKREREVNTVKKIYDKITEIKIDGMTRGFVDTSVWHHYHYCDTADITPATTEFSDYDSLFEAVADGKIPNASVEYTLFTSKPYLEFNNATELCHHSMKRKTFKNVSVRIWYKEIHSYSLHTLYENLPADEFLAYCADSNEKFYNEISKRG
jgi:hypothetical protein